MFNLMNPMLLAFQDNDFNGAAAGAATLFMLFTLAIAVVIIASMWKVFTKAGEPGWASIIPIYNVIVLLRIAGRPAWWLLLLLIPLVNIIIMIMVSIDIANNFGKGSGFGIGLALLGVVFYPILGFGDARYLGRGGAAYGRLSV